MKNANDRDIPSTLGITSYLHCQRCLAELPSDQSPMSYQRVQVGFTKLGLQVWCLRHDCNIVHIDFEGQRHPANTGRQREKGEPHVSRRDH